MSTTSTISQVKTSNTVVTVMTPHKPSPFNYAARMFSLSDAQSITWDIIDNMRTKASVELYDQEIESFITETNGTATLFFEKEADRLKFLSTEVPTNFACLPYSSNTHTLRVKIFFAPGVQIEWHKVYRIILSVKPLAMIPKYSEEDDTCHVTIDLPSIEAFNHCMNAKTLANYPVTVTKVKTMIERIAENSRTGVFWSCPNTVTHRMVATLFPSADIQEIRTALHKTQLNKVHFFVTFNSDPIATKHINRSYTITNDYRRLLKPCNNNSSIFGIQNFATAARKQASNATAAGPDKATEAQKLALITQEVLKNSKEILSLRKEISTFRSEHNNMKKQIDESVKSTVALKADATAIRLELLKVSQHLQSIVNNVSQDSSLSIDDPCLEE